MKSIVNDVLARNDFRKNPFFVELSGAMTKETFISTQNQFYFAVIAFTAPLALIASRITNYEDRLGLIKNLWEEHGGGTLSHTHGATFTEFMNRLSGGRADILPGPAVTKFNETLREICLTAPLPEAIGAIGMIERMFADISAEIANQVVQKNWLRSDQMIHYALHAELDHDHAEDFFSLLKNTPAVQIERGLTLGTSCFLELYAGLLQEARLEA